MKETGRIMNVKQKKCQYKDIDKKQINVLKLENEISKIKKLLEKIEI